MNPNTVLNICSIALVATALTFFIVAASRARSGRSTPLHPLAFTGFALLLAGKLCDSIRLESINHLVADAFFYFAILLAMVVSYFRVCRQSESNLGRPPIT